MQTSRPGARNRSDGFRPGHTRRVLKPEFMQRHRLEVSVAASQQDVLRCAVIRRVEVQGAVVVDVGDAEVIEVVARHAKNRLELVMESEVFLAPHPVGADARHGGHRHGAEAGECECDGSARSHPGETLRASSRRLRSRRTASRGSRPARTSFPHKPPAAGFSPVPRQMRAAIEAASSAVNARSMACSG